MVDLEKYDRNVIKHAIASPLLEFYEDFPSLLFTPKGSPYYLESVCSDKLICIKDPKDELYICGISIILEIDHMLYLHVVKPLNFKIIGLSQWRMKKGFTLYHPKWMGNYSFFFPKVLVLTAFILVLYGILLLQQLQG